MEIGMYLYILSESADRQYYVKWAELNTSHFKNLVLETTLKTFQKEVCASVTV